MNHITIDRDLNISHMGIQAYSFDDITIYIDGIIYVYGKKAGRESVEWLHEEMAGKGSIPYEALRGAYTCVIREGKRVIAFSDNSNMHCLYYSDELLSSSFLKAVDFEANFGKRLHFDSEAICEYLSLGNVFFGKTFYKEIHLLQSEEIATIEKSTITITKKLIGDIDAPSLVTSISDYFGKLAYSLSDMKVCQALTGGYDSRIIYACLSGKIKDHPSISANDMKNKDVKYANMVAAVNQDSLEVVTIEKPPFSESIIDMLFEIKDGIVPFDIDSDIRLLTYKINLAQNYNVHLTGDGGVLHKDWEWAQDFPLYRKKKSNARRFYRQRLYYVPIDHHIGDSLKPFLDGQEQRFEEELDKISKSINTQSYDSWYYRVSGNRRTDYNCNPIAGLVSYAPLEEMDIIRYSYALPRHKRFFYNSMRETITRENKQIARIKTNYGTNASFELDYILIDVFFQCIEYMRKAYRLLGRKLMRKNVMNKSMLDWNLEQEIRISEIASKAIEYALNSGFIKAGLSADSLSYTEIQRLIHIYRLHCFATEENRKAYR